MLPVRHLITVGLLAGSATAFGQEPINIERAIDCALKQNKSLHVLELSLQSSLLGVDVAKTEFSPSLVPNGTAGSTDSGKSLAYGFTASKKTVMGTSASVSGQISDQDMPGDTELHQGTITVELTQPLLRNLGPLVNREPVTKAESQVAAARRQVELKKTDLVVQVVETYEELLRLQRQLQSDEKALQRLDKLVLLTEARSRQGRASRVDVLRVEQQRGDAQLRVNESRTSIKSRGADFADLLGFPPERSFTVEPCPQLTVDVSNPDAACASALENRLDYAQVLQDHRDAERGVKIARRNLLPDLNMITRYQRIGEGPNASDATSFSDSTWFVGLSIESDLNRTKDYLALDQSKVSAATVKETVDIVEAGIRRQVGQDIAAYERTRADVLLAERNYHLAESRATLARRMFELGRGDNFSVTDAEDALLKAQIQWLQSQADVSVAAYHLLRTMGTLLECPGDLKPSALKSPDSSRS